MTKRHRNFDKNDLAFYVQMRPKMVRPKLFFNLKYAFFKEIYFYDVEFTYI